MGKIVGILSMQKVVNYGSFLQAYALKQLLLRNGADEVYFIDIKKGKALPGFETKRGLLNLVKRILYILLSGRLLTKIKNYLPKTKNCSPEIKNKKFYCKLKESIERNYPTLGLDKTPPEVFDLVVIGSDEVFNCCQKTDWGYTLQLYGDIPEARQVISFAGSFGHTTYGQLLQYGIDKKIGKTMRNLSSISVRDHNSFYIVDKITGIKPEIHLDPVLVYGYQEEMTASYIHHPERYMILYSYPERINDKNEIEEIVSFAKSKNLKLISISCRHDWCDESVIPDTPFDTMAWFKEAQYVVTDTFHGSIFSVLAKRNFCTLIRESNKQKISSLLQILNLSDRISKDITHTLEKSIDYTSTYNILYQERVRACEYLRMQLYAL